jgi:hypothetical protein
MPLTLILFESTVLAESQRSGRLHGFDRSQQLGKKVSKMKAASFVLSLGLCVEIFLAGCNKAPAGAVNGTDASAGRSAVRAGRSDGKDAQSALLSKEEVGAVLGQPVTTIEGKGTHLTYKTDTMLLETTIELDQKRDVADAVQAMQGARTATGFLGGAPEAVPGLGDDALFGAMSTLYLRKGSDFILIQPPNLQQMAGMKAYEKVRDAKLGSDEQVKAMEDLKAVQKSDPMAAGLQGGDATQGALATIKASSKKQGTEYEAQARAMAVALATKLLEKL